MSRTWSGGDFYRNQTIHFVLCFQAYFTKYNKKWICFETKKQNEKLQVLKSKNEGFPILSKPQVGK